MKLVLICCRHIKSRLGYVHPPNLLNQGEELHVVGGNPRHALEATLRAEEAQRITDALKYHNCNFRVNNFFLVTLTGAGRKILSSIQSALSNESTSLP